MRSAFRFLAAICLLLTASCLLPPSATAQQFGGTDTKGPRLGTQQTHMLRIGMVVTAQGGPCQGIVGTGAVPTEWPEQHVEEGMRDISASVRDMSYRNVGTVKQMVVSMPFVAVGDDCKAVIIYEVKRTSLLPPA